MADKKASLTIELKDLATAGLENLRSGMEKLKENALALGASFAGLSAFIYESITGFAKHEAAVTKLAFALSNVAGTTEGASKRLIELGDALAKTAGFTSSSMVGMQALLAQMGFNEAAIEQLTPRVVRLSLSMGRDLSESAMLLGKSLENGTSAPLKKMGVTLEETTFKNRDFAGSMAAFDAKVKPGMESVFGDTPQGKIRKFGAAVDEIKDSFGRLLAETLLPLLQKGTDLINWIQTADPALLKFGATVVIVGAGAAGLSLLVVAFSAISLPAVAAVLAISAFATNLLGVRAIAVDLGILLKSLGTVMASWGNTAALKAAWVEVGHTFTTLKEDTTKSFADMKTSAAKAYQGIVDIFSKGIPAPVASGTSQGGAGGKPNVPGAQGNFGPEEFEIKLAHLKGYNSKAEMLTLQHELRLRGIAQDSAQGRALIEAQEHKTRLDMADQFFGALASFSSAKSKELQIIGKIGAIANAQIKTHEGAARALGTYDFPYSVIVAGVVEAAGAAQVAQIAGIPLAAGGMALPTSGGTLARIGEAGKAEAVIPLDDKRTQDKLRKALGGGGVTVNVGTLVADQAGLEDFARRLDTVFWRLRKNNQTASF